MKVERCIQSVFVEIITLSYQLRSETLTALANRRKETYTFCLTYEH